MSPTRRTRAVVATTIALVIGVVGGWILSRSSDDLDARLTDPGLVQEPTIATNKDNAGEPFPFVPMRPIDGSAPVTVGGDGRLKVVNFWFSTCEPCKREMPALAHVATAFEGRIDFIGVNPNDSPASARWFLEKYSVQYPNYLDDGSQLASAGVATLPSTFFLDENDVILERHAGELTDADLRSTILRLYGFGQ